MSTPSRFKLFWIGWLWKRVPTCQEMLRLSSRSLEQPPSIRLKWKMWLHHRICVWCQRYDSQLRLLHGKARNLPERAEVHAGKTLSPDARSRMIQAVRSAQTR